MANLIQGDDKILYIRSAGVWVPLGCTTSNAMQEELEFISTTTRVSGGWETSLPSGQSYSIEAEAFTTRDGGVLSYLALRDLKRSRSEVEWKLEDSENRETGVAFISQIGETSEVGELISFSISLIGQGIVGSALATDPDVTVFVNPPYLTLLSVVESGVTLSWTVPDATYAISSFKVYRDNVFYEEILYSGSGTTVEYTDPGVVSGTFYSYNVTAVDYPGLESAYSNKVITPVIVPQPGGGNNDYIVFEDWDGTSGPPNYSIKDAALQQENGATMIYEGLI